MEEYKSNSLKVRNGESEPVTTERKIEPVISGQATAQKKSGWNKFAGSIITESFENVGQWLVSEVIIPNIKRGISDFVKNGIDMLIYGKAAEPRSSSNISKVSYGSFYRSGSSEPVRAGSSSSGFDYDNIIFSSRGDAEAVLTAMEDVLDQYQVVSVGDLYELADVPAPNYTVNKYGWTSVKNAQVLRCRDGYILKMPKATPL